MNALVFLVPAAAAAALLVPLLRGGREEEREERETDRRAARETLAEIEDDRALGLVDEEDREAFLRRRKEEGDE